MHKDLKLGLQSLVEKQGRLFLMILTGGKKNRESSRPILILNIGLSQWKYKSNTFFSSMICLNSVLNNQINYWYYLVPTATILIIFAVVPCGKQKRTTAHYRYTVSTIINLK